VSAPLNLLAFKGLLRGGEKQNVRKGEEKERKEKDGKTRPPE